MVPGDPIPIPDSSLPDANVDAQPQGYLEPLNSEQRLAVELGCDQGGTGPLLIIAGAGTGKTNTLAYRVAHLVCRGTDPRRILLLTFSRRAAAEMERRAGQILRRVLSRSPTAQLASLPWSGTFHSVGARLLREYAERIGLNDSFTIHDRSDSEDLMAMVRHELRLSSTRNRFPAKTTCIAIYSRTINAEQALADVLVDAFPWCVPWEAELKRLFAAYTTSKQAQNVLDYDDLLLYWAHAVGEASLAREMGKRFDHVLVDEYQDTNKLQARILLGLKPDGHGVTVVGDDAQAIYSFRAATVRNILDFPREFPQPAKVVTLDRNYRSTQSILSASNAVIALASERFGKNLWSERRSAHKPELIAVRDEADQAQCVAEQVLGYREQGIALKSQAVLFRSSHHSAQLELELARRDIPFVKYGGLRFLEAAHVKDVLCVLRWAENPLSRMAGFRAACLIPGIGPATASRLIDAVAASTAPVTAMQSFAMPAQAAEDWASFLRLFSMLRQAKSPWPAEVELVAQWYTPHLMRIYDDASVRRRDLVQLQHIAATYPSRERFLTELALDPPAATSDEASQPGRDDDYLILSTIHSAKGQEWKTVHVLNVVDGCIPSDMATGTREEIDEERRLLYVAMTRAKDHLHLLVPQRFYVHAQATLGDRHLYACRSRFIPESILDCFESCVWPKAGAETPPAPESVRQPAIDVGARARALWS